MGITRRRLLKMGVIGTGAIVAGGPAKPANAARVRRATPSILQGATDDSKTQFSVVHRSDKEYIFQARDAFGNVHAPARVQKIEMAGQVSSITKVFFRALDLRTSYTLTLFDALTGAVADSREFGLLDVRKPDLRFAVCSCMDEFRHSADIWQDLVARAPDVILFAGDSVYCDYGSDEDTGEAHLWRRFAESRTTLEIYYSKKLIPILATWDDHDFGLNDAGLGYPFIAESQRNFLNFYAMDPEFCSVLERGPGVSSVIRFNGQQFLMMDDRSFRVAGFSRARYAHWGREQEEWMFKHVAEFDGLSWIVNGSQVFPQLMFKESFSGDHPTQFEAFKTSVRGLGRKIALVSGDVHYSEISRIEPEAFGFETFELTSSSMHSDKLPGLPGLSNHRRRIASTGERNYLLVNCRPHGQGGQMRVDSRSAGGRVNFSLDLRI